MTGDVVLADVVVDVIDVVDVVVVAVVADVVVADVSTL